MFFVAAKIFWFFAQPLSLAVAILFIGLLAGLFGRRKLFATASTMSFLILALAAWTSLGALMLTPLEERYRRPAEQPAKVDGIIVLGGGLEGQINLVRGGYEMNRGGDRLVEVAVLARRYPQARLLISGGQGSLLLPGEGDGETAPRLLTALGVARERMVIENRSRDTYENAVFSREEAAPQPGETWLLVTSAFHMPRSKALFDKAGFATTPWPTDYRTSGDEGLSLLSDNASDSLDKTSVAMREWIGLLAYWLSGRIDSPFPGPA